VRQHVLLSMLCWKEAMQKAAQWSLSSGSSLQVCCAEVCAGAVESLCLFLICAEFVPVL
jgi:hypothetical protein